MTENTKQHLKELLESFDTAMLITRAGELDHARPMTVAQIESTSASDPSVGTTIWFVTRQDAPKSEEIQKDARVSATFQADRRFVALSGHAELVTDHAKVRELWRPGWKVWFPDGKDDPHLVLIKVQVTDAEFWDNAGAKRIRFAFEAARALFTKKRAELVSGQHGRVKEGATPMPPPAKQAPETQPTSQRH